MPTGEQVIHEMWAVHQALREFGFEPDDIYVYDEILDPRGNPHAGVALRAQGKSFDVFCGNPNDMTRSHLIRVEWPKFVRWAKTLERDDERLHEIWINSILYQDKAGFVFALLNKGFKIPKNQS